MHNDVDGTDGVIDAHVQQVLLRTIDAVLDALPPADAGYAEAEDKVRALSLSLEREARALTDGRLC